MIEIRLSLTGDESALNAIDAETWSPRVSPAPARDPRAPLFKEGVRPDDFLVAVSGDRVVGYVMLRQTIPLPSHSHVLEVNGLAVTPEHQGQGIGSLLVDAAKREAQRRGARKLSLRVLAPNTSARRLYESAGFTVEGVLRAEFVIDGQPVDDVLMACHLDQTVPSDTLTQSPPCT